MRRKQHLSKVAVGISSCLLGEAVRYDGNHSYHHGINHLADYFDFQPVCPEVGIGMGIPRDPVQLVRTGNKLHVRGIKDPSIDVTNKLHIYGSKTARQLEHIRGYIFKSCSPSCGIKDVRTFDSRGLPGETNGVGAFAEEIIRHFPNMPIEEEHYLDEPDLRDNFIERVRMYHHWKILLNHITPAKLTEFHAQYKTIVMLHSPSACERLDKLVGSKSGCKSNDITRPYETELMAAMKHPARHKDGKEPLIKT